LKLSSLLTCSAFLLSGCAFKSNETLISNLDHRYEYQETKDNNGTTYQALSMIGLLPTRKLGLPYYFNTHEGMDSTFQISPNGQTLYTTQTVGETVTTADIQNVAQNVLRVKRAVTRAISAKVNLIKSQRDKDAAAATKCVTAYQAAQDDLEKAQAATIASLKPGIIILQWGKKSRDQFRFSFTTNNDYYYNYQDRFKGLIILGGLKISSLSTLGKDYCSRVSAIVNNKGLCPIKNNIVIPTYLLQTRHLIFMDQFNDLEQESFSVSLSQAMEDDSLSALDKVELEMLQKQAYSFIGMGEISNVHSSTEPGCYNLNDHGSWIPLYAVLPTPENLYSKLKGMCKP
jgi:hypothetical protein